MLQARSRSIVTGHNGDGPAASSALSLQDLSDPVPLTLSQLIGSPLPPTAAAASNAAAATPESKDLAHASPSVPLAASAVASGRASGGKPITQVSVDDVRYRCVDT